jgi:hypothetical protein
MKLLRRIVRSSLLLGFTALGALQAAPDARLAGYWTTPPGAAEPSAFTFSIFGKWTIVSPHLPGIPDSRARYTVENSGNSGTLTMDEPPDKQPAAPRTIHYELQGGGLTIEYGGPGQSVRIPLVKGVPPSTPRPPEMVSMPKLTPPKPVQPPPEPPKPAPNLLGSWTTEPGVEKQLTLFIARGRTADVAINQQWIKGSDDPLVARSTPYSVTFANGRGQMSIAKPEPEGSAIPPVLNFAFEGDALVITVDDGNYAGQYRLIRKGK